MGRITKKCYWLHVSSRAELDTSIEQKYRSFLERTADLPAPWNIVANATPPPEIREDADAVADLTKSYGIVRRAGLSFPFRRNLKDRSSSDDRLTIVFEPREINMPELIQTVIPGWISALDAYLGRLHRDDLSSFEAKEFQTLRDELEGPDDPRWNLRMHVHRIRPVSFFDELLCRRAFGRTPGEVAERVAGIVEDVRLINHGVYMVGSTKDLPLDEALKLCDRLKNAVLE